MYSNLFVTRDSPLQALAVRYYTLEGPINPKDFYRVSKGLENRFLRRGAPASMFGDKVLMVSNRQLSPEEKIAGFTFMMRSVGVAFNEVAVALLDEPLSSRNLRRFAWMLAGATTIFIMLVALTPLSLIWFQVISGLEPELADMAVIGLILAIPTAGLTVFQSWFQGLLLHGGHTRGITEAVVVFLLTSTIVLWIGVTWGQVVGLYWAMGTFTLAMITQTLWLWLLSRPADQVVQERDDDLVIFTPAEG